MAATAYLRENVVLSRHPPLPMPPFEGDIKLIAAVIIIKKKIIMGLVPTLYGFKII